MTADDPTSPGATPDKGGEPGGQTQGGKTTGDDKIVHLFEQAVAQPLAPASEPAGGKKPGKSRKQQEPPPEDPDDLDDPDACPVICLGHADGTFWFLSPSGQVRGITDAKLNANGIRGLFEHRIDWLWERFPRYDKAGETKVGWGAAQAQEHLIKGCAQQGLFSAVACLRGDGAWRDGGGLIIHAGDAILVDGEWEKPGRYGRWVYPARPPQPRPAAEALSPTEAHEILALLRTWNWARPDIDPVLMLGWIGCATVCGALQWRPHVWLTGDKAAGKSWLHDLLRALLGGALESYANSTAAGIRDTLQGGARPVAIDELEADDEGDGKANALVDLARIASTLGGSKGVRGSPGGDARHFEINSTFIFSSILQPPLLSQDISRITQLDLLPLSTTPLESAAVLKRIKASAGLGGKLRRRVLDGWGRWEATLEIFATALADAEHENRATSQYGALLAMHDVLLGGQSLPDSESVAYLVRQLDARAMAGQSDEMPDQLRCLAHLMTSDLDLYRHGEKKLVGEEILEVMKEDGFSEEHHRRLRNSGLALVRDDREVLTWLAISNTHLGVGRLFHGTHWAARSGRRGAWCQSLRRLEGVKPSPNPIAFGGSKARALLVPLAALDLDLPKPSSSAPRKPNNDPF